ncbi:MAG: AraC family transcriptional regulator [Turicibacter sp.]|nr:AraC family transcriptional regulator [Turicibacter sp.]
MLFFVEQFGMDGKPHYNLIQQVPNHSYPYHLHRIYEIICVHQGAISLHIDHKKYLLTAGNLAFIFCNQIHGYHSIIDTDVEPSKITVTLFSPELIEDFHQEHMTQIPSDNVLKTPTWLDFAALSTPYSRKSALYYLCDLLATSQPMEAADTRLYGIIPQKIFTYVDQNFHRECTLKTAAKALQYDYAYLSKIFTQLTDLSFTAYVNNYRIAKACSMLDSNKHTITEISEKCGYQNLRTFNRNFQKVMNLSPKAYKGSKD